MFAPVEKIKKKKQPIRWKGLIAGSPEANKQFVQPLEVYVRKRNWVTGSIRLQAWNKCVQRNLLCVIKY
jgi:hypothetical protein